MSTVDLRQLTETRPDVQTLSGQDRGAQARVLFKLDELDHVEEVVRVVVPSTIRTISPSFLQGMLTRSISKFGSKDAFLQHYVFDAALPIREQVEDVVARILGRVH